MLDIFRGEAMGAAMEVAFSNYQNHGGDGFGVGEETDSLEEAVKGKGWSVLHAVYDREDCGPSGLYVRSPSDRFYAVYDVHGPFAISAPSPEEV